MKVAKDRVVQIDYSIRLPSGEVVESSSGNSPLEYIHGRSQIIPGVERAIEGAEPGFALEMDVGPDDAYGDRDPEGVFLVPRAAFPADEEVGVGMTFSATRPDGEPVMFRVLQADDSLILVDTNHPLAGKELRIQVVVRGVRAATLDELREGFAISDGRTDAPLPS